MPIQGKQKYKMRIVIPNLVICRWIPLSPSKQTEWNYDTGIFIAIDSIRGPVLLITCGPVLLLINCITIEVLHFSHFKHKSIPNENQDTSCLMICIWIPLSPSIQTELNYDTGILCPHRLHTRARFIDHGWRCITL
jgi:hypothetical protein